MRNCQPGAYCAGAGRRVAEADLRQVSVSDHPTTDIRETCTLLHYTNITKHIADVYDANHRSAGANTNNG